MKPVDIWDIEIVCRPEVGSIKTVVTEDGQRIKKCKTMLDKITGKEVVMRTFARKMANYCSIGIDARIGLGFDRNRSSHRIVNKLIYTWEGIKKFVRPKMNMHDIIEKMENLESFVRIEQVIMPEEYNQMSPASQKRISTGGVSGSAFSRQNSERIDSDFRNMNQRGQNLPFHSNKDYPKYYHGANKFHPTGDDKDQAPKNPPLGGLYSSSQKHLPQHPVPYTASPQHSQQHPGLHTYQHLSRHRGLHTSSYTHLPHAHTPGITYAGRRVGPFQNGGATLLKSKTELIKSNEIAKTDDTVINGYRIKTTEIFRTGDQNQRTLMISPINIIGLNIPSYMGGIADMWNKSSKDSPIKSGDGAPQVTSKQEMGDGMLEFLSFNNNLSFGVFERLMTGGGSRVAQGGGPFLITFKQSSDPVNDPLVTYAQVDGEYMQLINPLYYRIGLTPDLPHGKINGLFKTAGLK